jgi:hypothetical protein
LSVLSSSEFINAVKVYNQIIDQSDLDKIIKEKKQGFLSKYKTVEEVKLKIASLEKGLRDQEKLIQVLNMRNTKLAEFIIKHSISERITTGDLVELTDEYQQLVKATVQSIKADLVKEKLEHEELEVAIKLLNEPPYEEYHDSYHG